MDDEVFIVKTRSVACNGGGGALGHPMVYLTFDDTGEIVCPYCSRKYILDKETDQAA